MGGRLGIKQTERLRLSLMVARALVGAIVLLV
jgi:hypothetical protein